MQHSHHFHGQMSDTFRAAVFVTLSGGFQDAYTYISRGQVFAAGAGLGSLVTEFTDIRAIWVCCGLLLVSFILMFIRDDRRHERVRTSKPSSGDALRRSRARASYKTGPLLFCSGPDFLYKENHRQCRWFQKALAMHRKNVLL